MRSDSKTVDVGVKGAHAVTAARFGDSGTGHYRCGAGKGAKNRLAKHGFTSCKLRDNEMKTLRDAAGFEFSPEIPPSRGVFNQVRCGSAPRLLLRAAA